MQKHSLGVGCACVSAVLFALTACEEKKPNAAAEAGTSAAVTATPSVAAVPAATPSATPTPAAASKGERPSKIDTEVTPERRAAVEAKYPSAKGFLVGAELEEKLKANKALKDKKSGISAFDRAAQGKWVLFSGPLVNLTDDGFDLGIVYTPQLPNDPMGMSRQFFEVTLSKVEGYSKDSFKTGNVVVVLAKYNGNGKASPGTELVHAGDWK
jgi:hypothetical protein